MSWLVERGCQTHWDDNLTLTTPKGKVMTLQQWYDLPYLTKEHFDTVLADLPEASAPGRSGKTAGAKIAST